jgi:hypothetical protein
LLRADDRQAKEQIASGIAEGRRYQIVAPFRIVQDGAIFVPIRELVP